MDAYDIAIVMGEDANYEPGLRCARMFGKRIQIVAARHSADGKPPFMQNSVYTRSKVSDFPVIFIEDHAEEVRLVRATQKRVCRECGAEEETTWAGPDFYCSHCRSRHRPAD